MLFTGNYNAEILTWKIESLWQSIKPTLFYLVQIAHDIWKKQIYITVPLSGAIGCNFVLMMDYSDAGLNATGVKWSVWAFANASGFISKISMALISPFFAAGISYKLALAWGGLALYTLNPTFIRDGNIAIFPTVIKTG